MQPPNKSLAATPGAAPTPSETRARQSLRKPAQQSLPLEPAPRVEPGRDAQASRLWLCLHFPLLPLEALGSSRAPRAVFEEVQGVRRILLADSTVRAAGIVPGLSANAALALSPMLELRERNPAREAQVLRALAVRAERYTSMVSLEPPALLLEVAGSLRLFGGLENLWQGIGSELRERGFSVLMAAAPTPLASTWLAKSGRNIRLLDPALLTGTLAPLPLRCLEWPESVQEALNGMGLTCIGDCLRLPRQGFARRFGAGLLLQLDRALGRLPDPRASYRAPERFCRECDLQEEEHDSERLLAACRQLLEELEYFLISRQLAVQQLRFSFFHLRQDATRLTLRRRQAGAGTAQWSELLELRFDCLALPAPVIAIRLASGYGESLQAASDALSFDGKTGQASTLPIAHLMERLSARMGEAAVHGVALVDEHRPHCAWRATPALEKGDEKGDRFIFPGKINLSPFSKRRPLWMLPEPLRLETVDGEPAYRGPLRRVSGPERIESGWWDAGGIARDYFVAANGEGMRLWIYRERRGRADWYLHGLFG
ncbi:MAG TPA: DNA polymerase Y family protein [Woeseiaceae bacterium]|nr:DNA polymerase Y family protein [Woeseiaceae bacterium]